jgi:hypothetical protein
LIRRRNKGSRIDKLIKFAKNSVRLIPGSDNIPKTTINQREAEVAPKTETEIRKIADTLRAIPEQPFPSNSKART